MAAFIVNYGEICYIRIVMDKKIIDKIHLCLNELQMIRQLIDLKVADDFCSRVLGIYVAIRVDDITKLWSHHIPKDKAERYFADDVKDQYNDGLRMVRDKLGAHYQMPNGTVDLFGSLAIFKSIDYANSSCIIDAVLEAESKIEGTKVIVDGFKEDHDFRAAKEALVELYSDNQAFLTNGVLDVFGINKGCVMTGSAAQVKGQYLRSIELMVDVAYSLLRKGYLSKEVERLFKRLYVCMVYNYHDNLITRKDIGSNVVQNEDGFDALFQELFTINDNKEMMLRVFDEFENIYQIEPTIRKYRKIRDHACAHLDENSTVAEVNSEIDALDANELNDVYNKMLRLFNYVCNNVFLLKIVALPARVPLYDARMESVQDIENFYGEKPQEEMPKELTCTEIMRAIRKKDSEYNHARDAMQKKLKSHDGVVYNEMMAAICQRLREPSVDEEELTVIMMALYQADKGFPYRLQRSLVMMLDDSAIFKLHFAHVLWLLSSICCEDDEVDMPRTLVGIIEQKNVISTAFSILALLHLIVKKSHSYIVANNKAHDVSDDIVKYCNNVKNPTEKCALMLVLVQHWFCDTEYSLYRKYESQYTAFFKHETTKALNAYFSYIKLNNQEERDYCEGCLKTNHYLPLLHYLATKEKERNQKTNIYIEMWRYCCFYRTRYDVCEALAVGLLDELIGNKDKARLILESILNDNPINEEAFRILEDFYRRNPELKCNFKVNSN